MPSIYIGNTVTMKQNGLSVFLPFSDTKKVEINSFFYFVIQLFCVFQLFLQLLTLHFC